MPDARLSRRYALNLLLIAALATLTACYPNRAMGPGHNPCASGVGSSDRNHPLVCVNDETLAVDPFKITINDVIGSPGHPTASPVIVKWQTVSGRNDLGIEMRKKGCFKKITCNGQGECTGIVQKRPDQSSLDCSYEVNLQGRIIDPVVIVDPCCGARADATGGNP